MPSEVSRRLVVSKDKSEGAALLDASSAAILDAVEPLVALAVLASGCLVFARIGDTIASKGDGVIEFLIPVELILLQAGVADVGNNVIEGGAEDCRRPVAHALAILTPGASLTLRHILLVDVVVSRCGLALPEEVLALVWVG